MEATLVKKKEKENQVDSKQPRSLIIDIICVSVILNPIFDILSFIFRNYFETNISISTFLRPVIPVGCAIYFFIKSDKRKIKISRNWGDILIICNNSFVYSQSKCNRLVFRRSIK